MNRKLIVVLPVLTEDQTARIRVKAVQNGFEPLFFMNTADSLPELQDAEVILGGDPILSRNAPNLRWLCTPAAGINGFTGDDAFASAQAVLTNSSGAYGVTISEHITMLLMNILRRYPEYADHMSKREWVRRLPIRSIFGSRITLLGTGDIGQECVRRLKGFAPASLIGVNRSGRNPGNLFDKVVKSGELDQVLQETDILIISLPGTPQTCHMIGEKQLKILPDDAVIINVGRGTVIDQAALEKELRGGRLFAGLDVFEEEPNAQEDTIWDCPRLILTPHVAGDTTLPYTLERIVNLFLEDFERYCEGKPLAGLADRKAGY